MLMLPDFADRGGLQQLLACSQPVQLSDSLYFIPVWSSDVQMHPQKSERREYKITSSGNSRIQGRRSPRADMLRAAKAASQDGKRFWSTSMAKGHLYS